MASTEPVPFFHATTETWADGTRLTGPPRAAVCPGAVAALQAACPPGAPRRDACFFACENPENAVRFLQAELTRKPTPSNCPIVVYSVDFPAGYASGPMALVGAIEKKLATGSPVTEAVAEYWASTRNWQFLEFFGPEMLIIAPEEMPDLIAESAATFRYQNDYAQAADL